MWKITTVNRRIPLFICAYNIRKHIFGIIPYRGYFRKIYLSFSLPVSWIIRNCSRISDTCVSIAHDIWYNVWAIPYRVVLLATAWILQQKEKKRKRGEKIERNISRTYILLFNWLSNLFDYLYSSFFQFKISRTKLIRCSLSVDSSKAK